MATDLMESDLKKFEHALPARARIIREARE